MHIQSFKHRIHIYKILNHAVGLFYLPDPLLLGALLRGSHQGSTVDSVGDMPPLPESLYCLASFSDPGYGHVKRHTNSRTADITKLADVQD